MTDATDTGPPWPRVPYDERARDNALRPDSTCFICELVTASPVDDVVVYRDEVHVAFLPRFPTLEGYVLLAPIEHREQVVGDGTLAEYLALQAAVFRLGRAISQVTATERVYVLSLGSQQGNRHVHWHVAALPPGVDVPAQQFAALMPEIAGSLQIPVAHRRAFAERVRVALAQQDRS